MIEPPARLLVVDDEPLMRSLLLRALEGKGHRVDCCEDGHSALERLQKEAYDVVISDYSMPRTNGLELIQAFRAAGGKTPFILMTSYTPEEVLASGGSLEGVQFIRKPFGLTELHSAVRSALQAGR